jgi:hypothetical protein
VGVFWVWIYEGVGWGDGLECENIGRCDVSQNEYFHTTFKAYCHFILNKSDISAFYPLSFIYKVKIKIQK